MRLAALLCMTSRRLAVSLGLCLNLTIAGCHREAAPATPFDGSVPEPDFASTPRADLRAASEAQPPQVDVGTRRPE
jgi:hypothetical protein